jgi:hypothetical protein
MHTKAFGPGGFVAIAGIAGIMGIAGMTGITGLVGCGGSSGSSANGGSGGSTGKGGSSGTGTFSTSVPAGAKLSNLTSGQATQLCNDVNNFAQKTVSPDECKAQALLAVELAGGGTEAQLQATCAASYDSCLTADGGASYGGTCDPTTVTSGASCTATVGDLTACANAQVGLLSALPSCSDLTSASLASSLALLAADGGASSQLASCSPLDACTGISMSGSD